MARRRRGARVLGDGLERVDTAEHLRSAFAVARDQAPGVAVIASDPAHGLSVLRIPEAGEGVTGDEAHLDDPAIVFVTPTQDPSFLLGALAAGADAVVEASSSPDVLQRAISIVRAGGIFIDPAVANVACKALARLIRGWSAFDLSPRQLQVLWWLPTGLSCVEIAEAIGIAEGTVKSYLHRVQTKLGADDRMDLLTIARREGLL